MPPQPQPVAAEAPSPFGEDVASLRVLRSIVVRESPDEKAAPLGTVAQDMRVTWSRTASGPGCERWVEIRPRGWICDRYLEPNWRPPRALELPLLDEDELVPGDYARVKGRVVSTFRTLRDALHHRHPKRFRGSLFVRKHREIELRRRTLWKTGSGVFVDARHLDVREPSEFHGLLLDEPGAPLLPLGFVRGADVAGPATVWEEPQRWVTVGTLPPRTVVPVESERAPNGMVRLARDRYVPRRALRIARLTPPPAGLGPDERWIDVDLDEQVLVAYRGAKPIFATLVSTGRDKAATPEGEYRIWIKFAQTDMSGESHGHRYRVAAVPWTMYFYRDFALHTAYWHDRFGERASSGCVNLAPIDARFLYQWTDPDVPDGWSMVYASRALPGTLVRLHHGPPARAAEQELVAGSEVR